MIPPSHLSIHLGRYSTKESKNKSPPAPTFQSCLLFLLSYTPSNQRAKARIGHLYTFSSETLVSTFPMSLPFRCLYLSDLKQSIPRYFGPYAAFLLQVYYIIYLRKIPHPPTHNV